MAPGAPFMGNIQGRVSAMARSVTPATLGERLSRSESRSRRGTIYSSAVDAVIEKRKRIQIAHNTNATAGTHANAQ